MATMAFNKAFKKNLDEDKMNYRCSFVPQSVKIQKEMTKYYETLEAAAEKGAMFDSRCFNISKEEVCNLVYWRQLDATRNAIQMVGQTNFSHKQLQNKSCAMIQEMLFQEKGINFNNYPVYLKRGTACYNTENGWVLDLNMPILKGEDRNYVDRLINFE